MLTISISHEKFETFLCILIYVLSVSVFCTILSDIMLLHITLCDMILYYIGLLYYVVLHYFISSYHVISYHVILSYCQLISYLILSCFLYYTIFYNIQYLMHILFCKTFFTVSYGLYCISYK